MALLAHFTRRTTSGRFIAEVDGLRFVAVALVVVFHLHTYLLARSTAWAGTQPRDPLSFVAARGLYGVEIFFVISGFILGLPFAAQYLAGGRAVGLGAYFKRRVTRLEPPYIVAMLLWFVALRLRMGAAPDMDWRHLGASLLYVHNLAYDKGSTINGVAWSLEVEIQFYLMAPLLALAFFRIGRAGARRAALLGAMAAAVAGQTLLARWIPYGTLLSFVQFFLAGFLLADVYTVSWKGAPRRTAAWDVAWLAAWAGLLACWAAPEAVMAFAFPFLALVMCTAAFRGRWASACLRNPWITTVGGMCYTIYLLHLHVIEALGNVTREWFTAAPYWLFLAAQAVVAGAVVLAVSAVFFVFLERPCMDPRWPEKLRAALWGWRARPGVEPVAAAVAVPGAGARAVGWSRTSAPHTAAAPAPGAGPGLTA